MSTLELIKKIKEDSKRMTQSQRRQRLVDAHIIKSNGEFDPKYFTSTTVNISKRIVAKY